MNRLLSLTSRQGTLKLTLDNDYEKLISLVMILYSVQRFYYNLYNETGGITEEDMKISEDVNLERRTAPRPYVGTKSLHAFSNKIGLRLAELATSNNLDEH